MGTHGNQWNQPIFIDHFTGLLQMILGSQNEGKWMEMDGNGSFDLSFYPVSAPNRERPCFIIQDHGVLRQDNVAKLAQGGRSGLKIGNPQVTPRVSILKWTNSI